MEFADKLSALLSITGTSNIALARAIGLDPSQISRLRRGVRGVPRNLSQVQALSLYFARRCTREHHRTALAELIGESELLAPLEPEILADILYAWLISNVPEPSARVQRFIRSFDRYAGAPFPEAPAPASPLAQGGSVQELTAFYGNEGRRRAVRAFFNTILRSKEPVTVQYCADERLRWIMEDSHFAEEYSALLMQVIAQGGSYQRIQAPFVSIDQAFDSVSRWLPLYMTGAVQLYHYPRLRDNVYNRTLLVVPDQIALVSTTVGLPAECGTTFLAKEAATVKSFSQEFDACLALCRPMMTVYTDNQLDRLLRCIEEFSAIESDSLLTSSQLSAVTMPPSLAQRFCAQDGGGVSRMLSEVFARRHANLLRVLEHHTVTDVIRVATPQEIAEGKLELSVSPLLRAPLRYTPALYREHLLGIIALTERYENYRVIINDTAAEQGSFLYVKSGERALLVKSGNPFAVFELRQEGMVTAFWEYLSRISDNGMPDTIRRRRTVNRLRALAAQLEDYAD